MLDNKASPVFLTKHTQHRLPSVREGVPAATGGRNPHGTPACARALGEGNTWHPNQAKDISTGPACTGSEFEHDACGIGAIAHLKGQKSHQLLDDALTLLVNLEHRGGKGLRETPATAPASCSRFRTAFRRRLKPAPPAPRRGEYGVAMVSSRRTRRARRWRAASSRRAAPSRASPCSSGERCPSTRMTWARRHWPACPPSTRRSLGVRQTCPRATSSSASSTCAAAPSRRPQPPTTRSRARSATCAR